MRYCFNVKPFHPFPSYFLVKGQGRWKLKKGNGMGILKLNKRNKNGEGTTQTTPAVTGGNVKKTTGN